MTKTTNKSSPRSSVQRHKFNDVCVDIIPQESKNKKIDLIEKYKPKDLKTIERLSHFFGESVIINAYYKENDKLCIDMMQNMNVDHIDFTNCGCTINRYVGILCLNEAPCYIDYFDGKIVLEEDELSTPLRFKPSVTYFNEIKNGKPEFFENPNCVINNFYGIGRTSDPMTINYMSGDIYNCDNSYKGFNLYVNQMNCKMHKNMIINSKSKHSFVDVNKTECHLEDKNVKTVMKKIMPSLKLESCMKKDNSFVGNSPAKMKLVKDLIKKQDPSSNPFKTISLNNIVLNFNPYGNTKK